MPLHTLTPRNANGCADKHQLWFLECIFCGLYVHPLVEGVRKKLLEGTRR